MKNTLHIIDQKILQHKFVAIFLFFCGFLLLEYATYFYDPHDSIYVNFLKKTQFSHALENSKNFYLSNSSPLQTDEYVMLLWLWPSIASETERAHQRDLFYRLYSNDLKADDAIVKRRVDSKEELEEFVDFFGVEEFLYDFGDMDRDVLTDPVDDFVLKALYCDVNGYDQFDLDLLETVQDHYGGYGDTHYLLSLLFVERLGCVPSEKTMENKEAVINRIIIAEKKDQNFSDLFAERIVLLYWAGRGDAVRASWIKMVSDTQNGDGGWRDLGQDVTDPHATGLSALAIKYFIENIDHQKVLIK